MFFATMTPPAAWRAKPPRVVLTPMTKDHNLDLCREGAAATTANILPQDGRLKRAVMTTEAAETSG